ncbi:hypothetical protein [Cobetia amphilecti]|jgi:hypothetical protein|uniref:hypothetical protein n=1 Tax=Cobetia amphilecti TaxID=1055104 RepID=UPI001ADF38DE|nr:hypothetical protein [Cobetia amphilecti]|tara:strand:+ start:162 stop:353 length:192 start_codon:yes stop_codon:yes gene_type:complete
MRTLCRLLIPTGVEADADARMPKAMMPMKRPDTCSGLFLCLAHINLKRSPALPQFGLHDGKPD